MRGKLDEARRGSDVLLAGAKLPWHRSEMLRDRLMIERDACEFDAARAFLEMFVGEVRDTGYDDASDGFSKWFSVQLDYLEGDIASADQGLLTIEPLVPEHIPAHMFALAQSYVGVNQGRFDEAALLWHEVFSGRSTVGDTSRRQDLLALEAVGIICFGRGRTDEASTLLATASEIREDFGLPLALCWRRSFERILAGIDGTATTDFDSVGANGVAMGLDEALALARECVRPS